MQYFFRITLYSVYYNYVNLEPCRDDEFQCPDDIYGYCLSLRFICDHYEDCENGYDEQNCSTSKKSIQTPISLPSLMEKE